MGLFNKLKNIIMNDVNFVDHVLTEADFAASPVLLKNGEKVGNTVNVPENAIVDGVLNVTEPTEEEVVAAQAAQKEADEKAAAEKDAGETKPELTDAQKEAEAKRVAEQEAHDERLQKEEDEKAEADAKAGRIAIAKAELNAAEGEDPLAFITHPRRKQLAEMILEEATQKEFAAAGFGKIQVMETVTLLKRNGLLGADAPACPNCK